MKKFLSFAAIALCVSFASCSDEDDAYVPKPVDVSTGVFVINSGNQSSQISGSITSIDYKSLTATQKVFQAANGRNLGTTPNDAIIYGEKMYIVVTGENIVEVVNKNDMRSIATIKTADKMGADKGENPRHLASGNGKIYLSTFKGYVAEIDTTSFNIDNIYQAGSYPEGLAVDGNMLYVANSSYGNGTNPSISYINLTDGSVTNLTDPLITNPVGISVIDGNLYVMDSGLYDSNYNQYGAGVKKITADKKVSNIIEATMMAADKNNIYVINAPYSYTSPVTPTYSIYNIASGELKTFIKDNLPFSPSAIGVDPVSGNVFITSYSENPDTGYASYNTDGYINMYDQNGAFIKTFATGVGPTSIVFNTGVVYE